jgi:hypothetical protein
MYSPLGKSAARMREVITWHQHRTRMVEIRNGAQKRRHELRPYVTLSKYHFRCYSMSVETF